MTDSPEQHPAEPAQAAAPAPAPATTPPSATAPAPAPAPKPGVSRALLITLAVVVVVLAFGASFLGASLANRSATVAEPAASRSPRPPSPASAPMRPP